MKQTSTTSGNNIVKLNDAVHSDFESILNTIPDVILKVNLEAKLLWWNSAFENTTGFVSKTLSECSFYDLFKSCKSASLSRAFDDVILNGRSEVDALLFTPEGPRRHNLKCELKQENGRRVIIIIARDIHEHMKDFDMIVQSHTQLQKLLDTFPFFIFLTTPENDFILANQKYCEFFGVQQNKIIGAKSEDLFNENVTECFLRDNDKLLSEKSSVHYEGMIDFNHENISLSIDKFPMTDEYGNIYAICGVVEDITAQYQLQRQLQQTQKMEAIGQLTGGIAHDFNNVLASILGYAGLMKRTVSKYDDPTTIGYISQITRAGERARDLVQQMLAFCRGDVDGLKVLEPGILAKDSMDMLASVIPSSINMNFNIANNALNRFIEVDPVQFNQALMNLVINSKDAIVGEKGELDVNLEHVCNTQSICDSCHTAFSGDYIVLSVCDTGEGINKDILQRIFDPFFTTKGVGKGSGMGLSMVHGIVHSSGGHVVVKSSSRGTDIKLYFPVIDSQQVKDDVIDDSFENLDYLHAGKTILIIDDEPLITACLTEVLQYSEFKVVSFNQSNQGLTYFKKHSDEIDLIITDQTMPDLTGLLLAQDIADSGYKVPIILCSGYTELEVNSSADVTGVDIYMNKPFKDNQLLDNINSLLSIYSL